MLCGDEAYRCFGVETWRAEAGESRGVVRVRGGVTPSGKADRKGCFGALFGILRPAAGSRYDVSLHCRPTPLQSLFLPLPAMLLSS